MASPFTSAAAGRLVGVGLGAGVADAVMTVGSGAVTAWVGFSGVVGWQAASVRHSSNRKPKIFAFNIR